MNIFPMNKEQAGKHHWVVRCLRYYGYLITVISMIIGFLFGSENVAQMIIQATNWPKFLAVALPTLLCGIFGLCIGLLISLPIWAVSMALDDMHAMRQYMKGFVILGDKHDSY